MAHYNSSAIDETQKLLNSVPEISFSFGGERLDLFLREMFWGIIVGMLAGALLYFFISFEAALALGILTGVSFGYIFGIDHLTQPEMGWDRVRSVKSVTQLKKNGLKGAFLTAIICALAAGQLGGYLGLLLGSPLLSLSIGLTFGATIGLIFGFLRHGGSLYIRNYQAFVQLEAAMRG